MGERFSKLAWKILRFYLSGIFSLDVEGKKDGRKISKQAWKILRFYLCGLAFEMPTQRENL